MEPNEQDGARMMCYLAGLVGQNLTEEKALIHWRNFSSHEREQTVWAYHLMGGPDLNEDSESV